MAIQKIKIRNFKCFKGLFEIELNKGLNILVGNNETGKSTILEAIHIALTGLYGGRNIRNELSQYLFNKEVVDLYINSVNSGSALPPPSISIEIFFDGSIDPEYEGNENSEHDSCEGLKFEIAFNEKYNSEYNTLVSKKNMMSIPIEYYEASWTSFARQSVTIRSIPIKSAMIDSSNYRYQNGSDVYISRIVKDLLSPEEVTAVSQAHRKMKDTFMSNKLIIAAAGSGKTTHLVNEALKVKDGKVLITTYTEANEKEIIKKFYKLNGCVPDNITIQTWFSFLIQHGVKPYQSVIYNGKVKGLLLVNEKSGFRFRGRNGQPVYFGEDDPKNHYFSKSQLIYSDKLSKFVVKANELTDGKVIKRIGKIYSHIFIDEIQDMAGYDLEIIKLLFSLASNVLLVGDPRQVTYHTHDEAKYKKYTDGNIKEFVEHECSEFSVDIDETTLNKTYRNKQQICEFANSIYSNFKPCEYAENKPTGHDGVFFVSPLDVDTYLSIYQPVQLRDTRRTSVNSMYSAMNLGESKGLTFERVLIYPTSKMLDWILDHNKEMKPQSKSKFYVGVTRAKHSVAIVFDNKKGITIPGIINFTL